MKKIYFLQAVLWCLLAFAACGNNKEEGSRHDGESHYYEIRVEDCGQLGQTESGQLLLGQQYYQGEPVNIIGVSSASGETPDAMDVYICPIGREKTLFMGGVPRQYRVRGWYLDEQGRCFIWTPTGITRLDKDGNLLYKSPISDIVVDLCCTKGGRVILLTQKAEGKILVELDPDTGSMTPMEKISLNGIKTFINALGDDLMILDDSGVWKVDLKKSTKELTRPFQGTLYTLWSWGSDTDDSIKDFWFDGDRVNLLRDSGRSERLEWVPVDDTREIITVRMEDPDRITGWLKKQLALFNQSNDVYYAVIEESGEGMTESDFRTETNLRLALGEGADIICSDATYDVAGLIEKGIFADLAPLMEASGLRKEDYFPAALDAWSYGDGVYAVRLYLYVRCFMLDKAALNVSGELDIATFVDSLLECNEDRCWAEGWDSEDIINYFLQGSEDLWGMVDWEEGTCDFNGELFSKMLQAAKRYGADEARRQYPPIISIRETDTWYDFEPVKALEAKGQTELGYFFDGGIYPSPFELGTMGINAKSGNVEGAWQLLTFLLGEETQSTVDNRLDELFPANINAFNKLAQAELEYGTTNVNPMTGESVFIPGRYLGKSRGRVVLEEQAVTELRQVLSTARTLPTRTKPLLSMIKEEAAYYFKGSKSVEEVVALVQNRVQLYLDEHSF